MKINDIKNKAKNISNNFSSLGELTISIINTEENGKRIKLSKALLSSLNNPQYLEISIYNKEVFFIPDEKGIKISKNNIIYNICAVKEISKELNLDFSEKTSITLNARIEHDEDTEQVFAVIST